MKNLKIALLIVIINFLILQYGCKRSSTIEIEGYPVGVGNSWDYSRAFYTVVYDTINNDTTEYLSTDSLHEEFEGVDTMAGWQCYRLRHTLYGQSNTFDRYWWYANPDSALFWIAYSHNDTSTILLGSTVEGNIKFIFGELIFDSPEALAQYLHLIRSAAILESRSGTTYWSPPKKLFVYPLNVGKTWTSMIDPWLEEREVTEEVSVTVPAGTFSTLKMEITSDWMTEHDLWYNWISEQGIVKDSLHIRGIATDAYGNTIGYYYCDDTYELLNYHIEE